MSSSYILCQTRRAEKPYYIESISTNIYSLEELCYFMHHNLYLVDHTLVNEELCKWLEKEIQLPKLAAKLRPHLGKFASREDMLYPVFKEINYLTYEELRSLNASLSRLGGESLLEQKKHRGDTLMENDMYVNAIRAYQEVLAGLESEPDLLQPAEKALRAPTLHNLGAAYTRLFQMEKAQECYLQAYRESQDEEDMIASLLAFRSVRTPIEYESRLAELSVSREIRKKVEERMEKFTHIPEQPVYRQHVDELIGRITKEYHRSTAS